MALKNDQIQELKRDLLKMEDALTSSLQNENDGTYREETEELNSVDNHLADAAHGIVSREEAMAENDLKNSQLQNVQAALGRMEEGTYGKCVDTGEEIPFERLKAVPYAIRTVEAEQAHREKSGVNLDEAGSPSRLLKPSDGMQDSKARTIEEIEENHNEIKRPDEELTENEETPKGRES